MIITTRIIKTIKQFSASSVLILSLLSFASQYAYAAQKQAEFRPDSSYVAIIIDDLGYKFTQDNRALDLPGNVTYAFLPHTPNVKALADKAYKKGREIMLHLPMQAMDPQYLGPGGLTEDMNREEFKISLLKSIISLPHVKGVNNHMGSLITSRSTQMQWLMEELARTNLFFIDSRTSSDTVAERTANQFHITNSHRNVFLDHVRNRPAIEFQFDQLIKIAHKKGAAIAIGHPFPETLAVLEQRIPGLKKAGIQLIPASRLIKQQHIIADAREKELLKKPSTLTHNASKQNKAAITN